MRLSKTFLAESSVSGLSRHSFKSMAQFFKKRRMPNALSQRKIIVYPAKEPGEPLASKQLINERHLFSFLAVEIVYNPIADGTFRANLSRIAFYVVMLANLQP
jgi:hypothetical protein